MSFKKEHLQTHRNSAVLQWCFSLINQLSFYLSDELEKTFDHTADEFTLERIIELGFDAHAEKVSEISGAASKELAIEQSLSGIREVWEETVLDVSPYKDRGHYRLRLVGHFDNVEWKALLSKVWLLDN